MRLLVSVLPAAISACLDDLPPSVLDIHEPTPVGIEFQRLRAGLYAFRLPDDQPLPIAEGLPGDTMRATALVAGPEGPVALGERELRWLVCPTALQDCEIAAAPPRPPPCGPLGSDTLDWCDAGRGPYIDFELGHVYEGPRTPFPLLRLWLVQGTHSGLDADRCLAEASLAFPAPEIQAGCRFLRRYVDIGPSYHLFKIEELEGRQPGYDLSYEQKRPVYVYAAFTPRIVAALEVNRRPYGTVTAGSEAPPQEIRVPPNAHVRLTLEIPPLPPNGIDNRAFAFPPNPQKVDSKWEVWSEQGGFSATWYSTIALARRYHENGETTQTNDSDQQENFVHGFRSPSTGIFLLSVVLVQKSRFGQFFRDVRENPTIDSFGFQTWGHFRFVVEP